MTLGVHERRGSRRSRASWTVPHPQGSWATSRGQQTFFSRAHRKDAAERMGRHAAKLEGAEHVITRRDGSVVERLRYDEDGRLVH